MSDIKIGDRVRIVRQWHPEDGGVSVVDGAVGTVVNREYDGYSGDYPNLVATDKDFPHKHNPVWVNEVELLSPEPEKETIDKDALETALRENGFDTENYSCSYLGATLERHGIHLFQPDPEPETETVRVRIEFDIPRESLPVYGQNFEYLPSSLGSKNHIFEILD